ncbi:MAG: SusC/RagA family TonB-linked outer membrane protein [Bacteroidales bacterium]|nr:SusC/RagA family TonB-linked outer membrane protein [Bacteroidales bacterium]
MDKRILNSVKLIICGLLIFVTVNAEAQNLRFSLRDAPLRSVLKVISEQSKFNFVYSDALKIVDSIITIKANNDKPEELFKRIFPPLGILYKIENNQVLLSTREIAYVTGQEQAAKTQSPQKDTLNFKLTGVVKDDKGETLPGITLFIKTKNRAVSTDMNGRYQIDVALGDEINFSSIGFVSKTIKVTSKSSLDVVMASETTLLDEVVVVGYGTTKKSSLVGSVNTISSSRIEDRPITSVGAMLYGTAPGVMATSSGGTPGDDPNIRIRGFGTINSSSAPVIVVDGSIFDISLRTINPSDIESITILKDAASTAIYGSRGANGVVMITTKTGKKDRLSLSVNVSSGVSSRFIENYSVVSPQEYYQLMFEARRNRLVYGMNMDIPTANILAGRGGYYNGTLYTGVFNDLLYNPFKGIDNNEIIDTDAGIVNPAATELKWGDDLDWFKPMTRLGKRNEVSISLSGGTDKSDYYSSVGYLDDNAWMERSFTRRYSIRANVNYKPVKWIKIGTNIAGSIVDSYNQDWSGASSTNPVYTARMVGQIYPVYLHDLLTGEYLTDSDGNRLYDTGGQVIDGIVYPIRPFIGGNRNLVAELFADNAQYRRSSLQTRTYMDLYLLDGLKLTLSANIDNSVYMGEAYRSNNIGAYAGSGIASRTNRNNISTNYQQLLTYNKSFGLHSIEALVGHENYETLTKYNTLSKQGQIVDGNTELVNFTEILDATSYYYGSKVEGFLSRANYSYDNGRYVLEGSFRRDGSSKFYRDVRWGNFWSVGGSWNVVREKFMSSVNWIDVFKLRASYGINGNLEGISNYSWQDLYFLDNNNQNEPGYLQDTSAGNRALTWEKQIQASVGLDFVFFGNTIRGALELFNKVNDDLLFNVVLPASTGITSQHQNIGTMQNRGVELELAGDILKSENYVWTLGVNAAILKNEITRMPDDNPEIIKGTKKLMVGRSIYDFWLRDYYGVDPIDGAALFVFDENLDWDASTCRTMADGTYVTSSPNNARYIYSGSAIPSLYGSFYTSLKYRNFYADVQFGYQIGGKTYDALLAQMSSSGNYGYALSSEMLNRWQREGDITNVPRMDDSKTSVYTTASTRFLTDASHLVLKAATLSYKLPQITNERIGVKNLAITLSGENILLFSARKGMNPMESFDGETSSQYTPSRVVTLGIKFNL